MYNLIIFPFIYFFLNTSPAISISQNTLPVQDDFHQIYFIKQNWHTAVVFNIKDLNPDLFREYNLFSEFNLIDIGWGEEKFYQHSGFDSGLAFDALFFETPSALRVEGISTTKDEYFNLSEIVIELVVSELQFKKICAFINKTFYSTDSGNILFLSSAANNRIIFYKANGYYHLFNTCNTWLAKGLKQSGVEVNDDIILTEQLFNELSKIGTVIKSNYSAD